jgi:hypothetical protein
MKEQRRLLFIQRWQRALIKAPDLPRPLRSNVSNPATKPVFAANLRELGGFFG